MDDNFWKNAYSNTWDQAATRESRLIKYIQEITGLIAEPYGLGATTTNYISGSAKSNGAEKGDADLSVKNTNVYIEVTGPLSPSVGILNPIWIRPDKVNNAIRNMRNGHDTFIAHNCPSMDLWRIIHIDEDFAKRFRAYQFPVVTPTIRGNRERYIQIEVDDSCVRDISYLMMYLKKMKEQ